MKLQDQVITLEQAKRLGELGVIQARSLFFYDTEEKIVYNPWLSSGGYQYPEFCFSAFTVAELGVMLPDDYESVRLSSEGQKIQGCIYWCVKTDYTGECDCCKEMPTTIITQSMGQTEAESRAELLIHLLENSLTTPEECNQRLIN